MSMISKKIKVWRNRKYLRENLLCEEELCGDLAKNVIDRANSISHGSPYERFAVLEPLQSNRYGGKPLFRVKRTVDCDGELLNLDILTKYGIYIYSDVNVLFYYYIIRKGSKRPEFLSSDACPPNGAHIGHKYRSVFTHNEIFDMLDEATTEIGSLQLQEFDDYDYNDDDEEEDTEESVRCIDCDKCIKRLWDRNQCWCRDSFTKKEDYDMDALDIMMLQPCPDFKKRVREPLF